MTIATLYLKEHNKTGLKYLGITSKNPYKYIGSGEEWLEHIKEYGRHDVTTEVLYEEELPDGHKTSPKFKEIAIGYSHSLNIVEDTGYANAVIESGVIGSLGNLPAKYDWVGENKFNEHNESVDINFEEDLLSKDIIEFKDKYHTHTSITDIKELELKSDELCIIKELKISSNQVLLKLQAREERVLRMRFGMGVKEHTLEEIGQQFSLSHDRIRQIEAKALRKIKHPSTARKFRTFLDY